MHKMDYQDYLKTSSDKGKNRDQVPIKSKRKVVADYVVKQALAVQGDSSNESDNAQQFKDLCMIVVKDSEFFYDSLFDGFSTHQIHYATYYCQCNYIF